MNDPLPHGTACPADPTTQRHVLGRIEPAVFGLLCCIFAAVTYTVVNALLRDLVARYNQLEEQVWILFLKESVTVLVLGPWLLWQWRRGRSLLPSWRVLGALAAAGLATQLVGNLSALWAFSRIGLSIAVPLMSGVNLVASAALGWVFLGERVSRQWSVAIGLLLAAVVVLSLGAPATNESIAAAAESLSSDPTSVAVAILGSCCAGVTYAVLAVVIRRNVTAATRPTAVVFMITLMGMVSLGPVGTIHCGLDKLAAFSAADLAMALAAGAINLVAFVAITKGFQLTPVARANVLSASQVALGAVVGMFIFGEPGSPWLALGVCFTLVGMVLIGRRDDVPETPETPI